MKKISVIVPCYNEEKSLMNLYNRIVAVFKSSLQDYDFELVLADDYSKDSTRELIRTLCKQDKRVKGVFNGANFGFSRNVFASLQEARGDAAFLLFGDLQDPPELLPEFVHKWEEGSKVVLGCKVGSEEGAIISLFRKTYYKLIDSFSEKPQIRNFNGFGLYDKSFIAVIKEIGDIQPYLKSVVSEYAPDHAVVYYKHLKSLRGKSNFNFYRNYDFAMEGITSSTKKLMRISTLIGAVLGGVSAIYAISVFVRKLLFWDTFPIGLASIMVGVYMLGAIQLFFIGILGEYLLSINIRTMRKPRVVVEERINCDDD